MESVCSSGDLFLALQDSVIVCVCISHNLYMVFVGFGLIWRDEMEMMWHMVHSTRNIDRCISENILFKSDD